jgi:hypothetical protein
MQGKKICLSWGRRDFAWGHRGTGLGRRDSAWGHRGAGLGRRDFAWGRRGADLGRRDSAWGRRGAGLGRGDFAWGRRGADLGRGDSAWGRCGAGLGRGDSAWGRCGAGLGRGDFAWGRRAPDGLAAISLGAIARPGWTAPRRAFSVDSPHLRRSVSPMVSSPPIAAATRFARNDEVGDAPRNGQRGGGNEDCVRDRSDA